MTQYVPEDADDSLTDFIARYVETPMTDQRRDNDWPDQRWMDRENRDFDAQTMRGKGAAWLIAAILALTVLAYFLSTGKAHAQTTCAVGGATTCFGGSKTTGESPLATTLTWSVLGATSCTAGGVTAWSGSIPCSGTRNLTGITVKMTLTIDAVAPPTAGKMRLKFNKPTQNTDNTPLTTLGGYLIEYGTSAGSLSQTVALPLSLVEPLTPTVAEPFDSAYNVTGLAAGTWFATVKAETTSCFPTTTVTCYVSQPAGPVSRAVTTTPGGALPQLSLVIDPFQVPKPPSNLTVTDPNAAAYEIWTPTNGVLTAHVFGVVWPNSLCASENQRTVGSILYSRVDRGLVQPTVAALGPDKWVHEPYAKCTAAG